MGDECETRTGPGARRGVPTPLSMACAVLQADGKSICVRGYKTPNGILRFVDVPNAAAVVDLVNAYALNLDAKRLGVVVHLVVHLKSAPSASLNDAMYQREVDRILHDVEQTQHEAAQDQYLEYLSTKVTSLVDYMRAKYPEASSRSDVHVFS